jgi:DNA-3-methyladenine glycosylase II
MPVFRYGETELLRLKAADGILAGAIARLGPIRREIMPDLFEALVHSISGQQISGKARQTIWGRLKAALGRVTPERISGADAAILRGAGLSGRKTAYIKAAAERILSGELDISSLAALDDAAFCGELTKLDGVGLWTAEMLLVFSLERPNVLSWGDLGLRTGMKRLYGLENLSRDFFEECRNRYSPYATVASFYLWAVAGEGKR